LLETVGVNLDAAALNVAAKDGLAFELAGRGGSVQITVPATYFQGYQDAYHEAWAAPTAP
jgi:hypothetical protein